MSHSLERRSAPRRMIRPEHGLVSALVRPGHHVSVLNVSIWGALIESGHRLLPDTIVELHMATHTRRAAIRGRVLRCEVFRLLATRIWYRGALRFDRHFPWFLVDAGMYTGDSGVSRELGTPRSR